MTLQTTSFAPIKLSDGIRPLFKSLPNPLMTLQRILAEHQERRILRRLTTPDKGTYAITMSFHRVWQQLGAITVVLVQSLITKRYALYTEVEMIAIIKESLALRSARKSPTQSPSKIVLEADKPTSPAIVLQADKPTSPAIVLRSTQPLKPVIWKMPPGVVALLPATAGV